MHPYYLLVLLVVGFANAEQIVITVANNTDPTKIFQPASVTAKAGDTVYFNFTLGNHTATQSTFSSPCIPAHDTDTTINGFNSGFRDAGNGQAITNLAVIVENPNVTIWFFDYNTCAQGGGGAININDSTLETLDGFQRNAIRLNNSAPSSTASSVSSTSTTASSPTQSSNDAKRTLFAGAIGALSLFITGLLL